MNFLKVNTISSAWSWAVDRLRPGGGPLQPLSRSASPAPECRWIEKLDAEDAKNVAISAAETAASKRPEWMLINELDLAYVKSMVGNVTRDIDNYAAMMEWVETEAGPVTRHRHEIRRRAGVEVWEYRCRMRCGSDCKYRAKAEYEEGTGLVRILKMYYHNEHKSKAAKRGLPAAAIAFLEKQLIMKTPIRAWHRLIREPGFEDIPKSLVQNYYKNHAARSRAKVHANTLAGWRQYIDTLPKDIIAAEDDDVICPYFTYKPVFRLVLTTKRRLRLLLDQRRYHVAYKQADATYKLTYEGHPILMVGTITWQQQFIHTGLMISDQEKEMDFMVLEATIRSQLKLMAPLRSADGGLSHAIPYMTADAAAAIKNGEEMANLGEHDEELFLTCYAHMMRAKFNEYLVADDPKAKTRLRSLVKKDLLFLHMIPWGLAAAFDYLVERWKEKWISLGQEAMVKWFDKEWLGRNKRWSRAHAPPGIGSTSNALERYNRHWKDATDHERPNANHAVEEFVLVFGAESKELKNFEMPKGPTDVKGRHKGDVVWMQMQTYLNKADVKGLIGVVDKDLVLYPGKHLIDQLRLHAERAEEGNVDEEAVQRAMVERGTVMAAQAARLYRDLRDLQEGEEVVVEVNGKQAKDFNSIVLVFFAWRYLTSLPNLNKTYETSEVAYQCSCLVGQKRGICKHALVHTHHVGLCSIPEDFQQGNMKRKRGVGRPKRTKGALERQPGEQMEVAALFPPRRVEPRLEAHGSPDGLDIVPVRKSTRERRAVTAVDV